MEKEIETPADSGLSRRSVINAAAWSATILALSVAAPLAAATNVPEWDLGIEVLNCSPITAALGGDGVGFRVRAVSGDVPQGTVLNIQSQGLASINLASITTVAGDVSIFGLDNGAAQIFLPHLTEGQYRDIVLTGLGANIGGSFQLYIDPANATGNGLGNDGVSGISAGNEAPDSASFYLTVGANIGEVVLAICKDTSASGVEIYQPVPYPIHVGVQNCGGLMLLSNPRFEVRTEPGATIPAGTKLFLYSANGLAVNAVSWSTNGAHIQNVANTGVINGLGGGSVWEITTTRDITSATPLHVNPSWIGAQIQTQYSLIYPGVDSSALTNSAANFSVTGVSVVVPLGTCTQAQGDFT